MSTSSDERHEPSADDSPGSISDEQLPEDLRPTDDNPLAKPLEEDDDTVQASDDTEA